MLKSLEKTLSFKECLCLEKKYLCKVVVVSKKQGVEKIQKAYAQGFRHFGESYLQEALLKQAALKKVCPDIVWHFVGNIQSNKLKLIVPNFSYLHSVGSLNIVNKIIAYKKSNSSLKSNLKIFLQVNISKDPKKSGFLLKKSHVHLNSETKIFASQDFLESIEAIKHTPQVYLQGFMTMPFLHSDLKRVEFDFQALQLLSLQYSKQAGYKLETSMGTSCDYKTALSVGTSWVRLGEIILGSRA